MEEEENERLCLSVRFKKSSVVMSVRQYNKKQAE